MSFVPWFSFSFLTPNFLTYLSFDAGATNRFLALLTEGRGAGQKYVWVEVCFSAKTNSLKQIYKCDQVSIFTIIGVHLFPPKKVLKRLRG